VRSLQAQKLCNFDAVLVSLSTSPSVTGGQRRVSLHMLAERASGTAHADGAVRMGIRQSAANTERVSRAVSEVGFRHISAEHGRGQVNVF
jgi:hypothetical protein